jgi:serine protease Do
MRTGIATILTFAGLSAGSLAAQQPDPDAVVEAFEQATTSAVERAAPAVVSIGRLPDEKKNPPAFPFPRAPIETPDWRELIGTGVILKSPENDDERFVLTNRHVVIPPGATRGEPASRLVVVLSGRLQVNAEVFAADPRSDLAVLRLDLLSKGIDPADLPAIEFGEAETFRKGRFAVMLGNPYAVARDGSASVSIGTIANISRSPWNGIRRGLGDEELTIHHLGTLWHLDSRTSLGASGAAVIDFKGKLVGLTTSLAAVEGYESSVGYAIPMTAGFRRIVDSLLRGYEVEYGFLGIAPRSFRRWGPIDGPTGSNGADVVSVAEGSPADLADVRPGDSITSVNGVPVRKDDDLIREIGLPGPDASVTLEIDRRTNSGISKITTEVRLGKWPVYDDTAIIAPKRRHPAWRGLEVDYPTARRRFMTDLFERFPRAVGVIRVEQGGPAYLAGLREGLFISQVNDQPVTTPAEFAKAVKDLTGPVRLRLADDTEIILKEQ